MKHLYFFCLVNCALCAALFSGCSTASKPEGMPAVAPCSITVLNNGVPVSGAEVELYRSEGNGALRISAITNASGVAAIQTAWANYKENGAPVGVSKITIIKHVNLPDDGVTQAQQESFTPVEALAYEKKREKATDELRVIPKQLSLLAATPLGIKIEEKTGGTLTVDIKDYEKGK